VCREQGAGHLQLLAGSGCSLELVAGSRQALAVYAGDEDEASRLPRDWQRLHRDRDMRVSLHAGRCCAASMKSSHQQFWLGMPVRKGVTLQLCAEQCSTRRNHH